MRRVLAVAIVVLLPVSCRSFSSSGDEIATELKTDHGVIVGHVSFHRSTVLTPYVVLNGYVTGVAARSDHGMVLTKKGLLWGCTDAHLSYPPNTSHGLPNTAGNHLGDLGNGSADDGGVIWINQHVDWLYDHFADLRDCCFVVYEQPDDGNPPAGGLVNPFGSGRLH